MADITIPIGLRRRFTVKRGTETAPASQVGVTIANGGLFASVADGAGGLAILCLGVGESGITFAWGGQTVTLSVEGVPVPLTVEWQEPEPHS